MLVARQVAASPNVNAPCRCVGGPGKPPSSPGWPVMGKQLAASGFTEADMCGITEGKVGQR